MKYCFASVWILLLFIYFWAFHAPYRFAVFCLQIKYNLKSLVHINKRAHINFHLDVAENLMALAHLILPQLVSHSLLSISLDFSVNEYPIQLVTKPFMARIIFFTTIVLRCQKSKTSFCKENFALVFCIFFLGFNLMYQATSF